MGAAQVRAVVTGSSFDISDAVGVVGRLARRVNGRSAPPGGGPPGGAPPPPPVAEDSKTGVAAARIAVPDLDYRVRDWRGVPPGYALGGVLHPQSEGQRRAGSVLTDVGADAVAGAGAALEDAVSVPQAASRPVSPTVPPIDSARRLLTRSLLSLTASFIPVCVLSIRPVWPTSECDREPSRSSCARPEEWRWLEKDVGTAPTRNQPHPGRPTGRLAYYPWWV